VIFFVPAMPLAVLLLACGGPDDPGPGAEPPYPTPNATTDSSRSIPSTGSTAHTGATGHTGTTGDSGEPGPTVIDASQAWFILEGDNQVLDGDALGFPGSYSPPGAIQLDDDPEWELVAHSKYGAFLLDPVATATAQPGVVISTDDATFLPYGNVGSWPIDEDGDGVADDLLTYDSDIAGNGFARVWLGPVGTSYPVLLTGMGAERPCTTDITGDGVLDLVGTDGGNIILHPGPLAEATDTPTLIPHAQQYGRGIYRYYCLGDVTGDGLNDVWSTGSAARLDLTVGPLTPDTEAAEVYSTHLPQAEGRPMVYRHWNGDDDPVLFFLGAGSDTSSRRPSLWVFHYPLEPPFDDDDVRVEVPVDDIVEGGSGAMVADVNRDGTDDLVFMLSDSDGMGVLYGPLGYQGWEEGDLDVHIDAGDHYVSRYFVYDLDNDGWLDIGYSFLGTPGFQPGQVVVHHGAELFGP